MSQSSQILAYPDFEKPFNLTTDASQFALGAVLSQGEIGKDRPVAFASRTLNKAEINLSTIEKELLAIVWACAYFRPYLFGRKFILNTDHQPLVYLFNMKDPSSKLVRWRLKLEEYDYQIIYRPGNQNQVADALSRITNQPSEAINSNETQIEDSENNDDFETVHSADYDDSHFIQMTLLPINNFSNQIILEKAPEDETTIAQIFTTN